jgi:nickel/cobalt transporter (NicO) family protein
VGRNLVDTRIGTAITVTAIAMLPVKAKSLAFRFVSGGESGQLALRGLEMLAGLAGLAFGILLLAGNMTAETTLVHFVPALA